MNQRLKIAVNTGGGDAHGLNVVIYAVTMVAVPLQEAAEKTKPAPLDSDSIVTARDMGISVGDG